jgi:hypothetical protein
MYQDTLLTSEPRAYLTPSFTLLTPRFMEKPGSTPSASKTMADRITGTEILLPAQACHFMETAYKIRR